MAGTEDARGGCVADAVVLARRVVAARGRHEAEAAGRELREACRASPQAAGRAGRGVGLQSLRRRRGVTACNRR